MLIVHDLLTVLTCASPMLGQHLILNFISKNQCATISVAGFSLGCTFLPPPKKKLTFF